MTGSSNRLADFFSSLKGESPDLQKRILEAIISEDSPELESMIDNLVYPTVCTIYASGFVQDGKRGIILTDEDDFGAEFELPDSMEEYKKPLDYQALLCRSESGVGMDLGYSDIKEVLTILMNGKESSQPPGFNLVFLSSLSGIQGGFVPLDRIVYVQNGGSGEREIEMGNFDQLVKGKDYFEPLRGVPVVNLNYPDYDDASGRFNKNSYEKFCSWFDRAARFSLE